MMNKKQEKRKLNPISDENGDSNAQSNGKNKTKPVNKKARTDIEAIQEETQSESEASEIETPSKVVLLKKNGSIPIVNDYLIIFNCNTDQMYEYLISHGISLALCEIFQGIFF
jgi:hypothetical protein